MADRYAYIPLIGIFVMISFGVADFAQQKKIGLAPAIPAAIILVAFAFATYRQIGYWQSNDALWSHALAVTENNFVAEDNLGGALILEDKEEEAHAHFEAAARINPKDPMSRSNLGTYYQTHNRMREAIAEYRAAVELTSDPILLSLTYANLGAAHLTLGEYEAAHQNFDESLAPESRPIQSMARPRADGREAGQRRRSNHGSFPIRGSAADIAGISRTRPFAHADRARSRGARCLPAGAENLS